MKQYAFPSSTGHAHTPRPQYGYPTVVLSVPSSHHHGSSHNKHSKHSHSRPTASSHGHHGHGHGQGHGHSTLVHFVSPNRAVFCLSLMRDRVRQVVKVEPPSSSHYGNKGHGHHGSYGVARDDGRSRKHGGYVQGREVDRHGRPVHRY
ncbi:hypothetical protein BDR04DRAFT_548051 [Suillus decipiens]|nr:hypothetical protein BDR04DRAFT_548051 [Suillus decipiens]